MRMRPEGGLRCVVVTIVVCLMFFFNSLQAQTAVGKWRPCLDYSNVAHVTYAGDRVYAGAKGGVFCYDLDDNTLTVLSKGAGLNDVGIATMGYDAATRCLVVAYINSNIDIIRDNRTYNLSDIKRSDISGDKNVYHVRFANGNAYLATGFGVVVLDLERMEIKETWYLGAGGVYAPVYDLAFMADSLYAATGEGLKRIATSERHPAISDRWTKDTLFGSEQVFEMAVAGSHLLLAAYTFNPDSNVIYRKTDTGYVSMHWGEVNSLHEGAGRLAICLNDSVLSYDTTLTFLGARDNYVWGALVPHDAVYGADGTLWVAHLWEGIIGLHADGTEEYHRPDGPNAGDNVYRLKPFGYRMMLCPGGHTEVYSSAYLPPNLYTAVGRQWTFADRTSGILDSMSDVVDASVNPADTHEVVAALWGHGLASIRDNVVQTFYDASNTDGALVPYSLGGYSRLNTGAVEFDRQGNLWVLISHSTHALAVRQRNGEWKNFSTTALGTNLEVDKLVLDSVNGYKWFLGRSNVIYVHDGKSKLARVDPNRGSKLETESVTALVQDHNGNLWLGTNKGLKVIYDGYKAFSNGGNGELSPVTCSNITISNGEFSEYLMAYESITAIAVDGANRKWVGTQNGGLYLLSGNGMEQLEHFTIANSPLFSNRIITLGINERTGEVYVGTDRGVQVYRGTATYAVATPLEEVYAFPNPVKPDYDGPIAIKGFTRNGLVHITDASGHTVYTTTANGGQVIWNGRTLKGERVASGVYYVFASDAQGNNRSVAKILIVR